MKKLLIAMIAGICIAGLAVNAYSDTSVNTAISGDVGGALSIEFDDDSGNVTFTDPASGLPITDIDPTSDLNYLDGHSTSKSDLAVICKSNSATGWHLTSTVSGTLTGKVIYYMGQPTYWNGTTSVPTDGRLGNRPPTSGQPWPVLPSNTIYTSGSNDGINTPEGTYCGMDLGVNGGGLTGGGKSADITFTIIAGA